MACYCCEETVPDGDEECEYFDCYYDLNILWIYTITVCQYRCGSTRVFTQRWRRFLWWCKRIG